jgi:hypothetical protein
METFVSTVWLRKSSQNTIKKYFYALAVCIIMAIAFTNGSKITRAASRHGYFIGVWIKTVFDECFWIHARFKLVAGVTMFFNFGKKTELLDLESVHWMYDVFAWALRNFDAQVFFQETVLVTPSNAHFPGQASGEEDMANLIFEKVKEYAGLKHWPCRLVDQHAITSIESPRILIEGALRGSKGIVVRDVKEDNKLTVTYNPVLLNDPQIFIASYAYTMAHYLGLLAQETPPGGEENRPHVTELLAVFLGFGLMMANTAFTSTVRSCGSCAKPGLERTNYLSQYHVTYALAIFSSLKGLEHKAVLGHLKKTLHPFFKRALKEVNQNQAVLERLRVTTTPTLDVLKESTA